MDYIYSKNLEDWNDSFLKDLIHIDSIVYDPEAQGTYESVRDRFCANRDSVILVYDDLRLAGYIAFFPITQQLSARMLSENKPFDDDILPGDILPTYTSNEAFDVFFISVAVLPAYQRRGLGAELVQKWLDYMSEKIKDGCKIRNGYAYAYSDEGARLLSKSGLYIIKDVEHQGLGSTVSHMGYNFIK